MDELILDEPKEFKFTEEYIQRKLNGFFSQSTQKYVLENLYVFKWESDKFIETRSGLIYEFEIKISRSDFKHDFDKKDKHVILEGKEEHLPSYEEYKKKYSKYYGDELGDKYYRTENYKKPNYFYYAVPEGMIDVSEVPEYAGLVYVLPEGESKTKEGNFCWDGFYVVKNAPKLHNTKYADDDLKLSEKFYYNMLSWKDKCWEEKHRRLLTEENKIPYAEMNERMKKAESENRVLKAAVDNGERMSKMFAETMEDDRRIILAYRNKIRELIPGFDFIKFEDEFLKEYD